MDLRQLANRLLFTDDLLTVAGLDPVTREDFAGGLRTADCLTEAAHPVLTGLSCIYPCNMFHLSPQCHQYICVILHIYIYILCLCLLSCCSCSIFWQMRSFPFLPFLTLRTAQHFSQLDFGLPGLRCFQQWLGLHTPDLAGAGLWLKDYYMRKRETQRKRIAASKRAYGTTQTVSRSRFGCCREINRFPRDLHGVLVCQASFYDATCLSLGSKPQVDLARIYLSLVGESFQGAWSIRKCGGQAKEHKHNNSDNSWWMVGVLFSILHLLAHAGPKICVTFWTGKRLRRLGGPEGPCFCVPKMSFRTMRRMNTVLLRPTLVTINRPSFRSEQLMLEVWVELRFGGLER